MNQDYMFMKRLVTMLPPRNYKAHIMRSSAHNNFLFFGFLLFMLSTISAFAQVYPVSAYTFEQSTATYSPITGTEATTTPTDWDNGLTEAQLGFSFVFNGLTYTSANINYNGFITFGTTTSALTTTTPISTSTAYKGAISAFGVNLKGSEGITYSTVGSAPNRTFIVQWNNAKRVAGLGVDVLNFQIRLNETTNTVAIVYGTCTATLSNASVQVGLRGLTTSDYNNRTSSASWITTTKGTSSGSTISTSPIILPTSGLQFTYTPPPACVTPTAPTAAVSGITSTLSTVTITPAATPATGYVIIRSTSPTPTIPVADGTIYSAFNTLGGNLILSVGSTTTISNTALLPNTTYYYFVYAYNSTTCGGGPLYSPIATVSGTTCVPGTVAAAASNITGTTATVNWSKIPVGTPTYTLEVYTDAAFTTLFGTAHTGLTTTSFNLTGLTAGTTYYFRVKGTTTAASCTDSDFSTGSFTAKNGFTPLTINAADFNADVIANGPGLASTTTTQAVDNSDYAYVAQDYRNTINVTGNSYGLPNNRTLVSGDVTYLLADYSGNNSLRLTGTNSGILHLATPTKLSNVYVAATSGGGASVVNIKILFSDNSTQDVGDVPINDWFDNGNYIVSGIGRVSRTDGDQNASQEGSKIFQIPINIDFANQGKTVTGVQVTEVSGEVPNIFAISGRILTNCPALNYAYAAITSGNTATVNWSLGAYGDGATSVTYNVEVYTDAAFTKPFAGFPQQNLTTTSIGLTNLVVDTTYYIRVQAKNGSCTSDYVTTSFSIKYCTPTVNNLPNAGITSVALGTINKASVDAEQYDKYNNYSYLSTTSWPTGSVAFSIATELGGSGFEPKIWVDWNDDTDFDDDGEQVYLGAITTDSPVTIAGAFNVPANAPLGNHRVRIGIARNNGGTYYTGPAQCSAIDGDYLDFTIKLVSANCPVIAVTPSIATSSSIKLDWVLNNPGTGNAPTYTVEVYSDADYTKPVTGSPFTLTATTLTVPNLAQGTYYYKVKATSNVCPGDYVTGSIGLLPCIPTNSATDDLANTTTTITNVTTTNGIVNIANATGQDSGFTDYTYLSVSQVASGTFDYSISVKGFSAGSIWIDWNNDLTFTDDEKVASLPTTINPVFTGTITVPAGTPVGKYRMRIRSRNGSNASPCEMITWSEAEDYMVNVVVLPTCFAPTGLTATGTGTTGAFSWTAPATGNTPVGYEYAVSTSTTAPATGTAITTTSASVTLTTNVLNYLYVRTNCGDNNYSDWTVTTFFAGYCTPPASTPTYFINNFTTTGGQTNIDNTASGYSEGGYGDFTTKSVSQLPLGRVNFAASFTGNATYGFAVWVDWNNDYDFNDDGERVYQSTEVSAAPTGFFTVPAAAVAGNYRMRVLADIDMGTPVDPCLFRLNRGEIEDYILTVTAPCVNPAAPQGAETQTFVEGETIKTLKITTLTDATVAWFTKNEDDTYTSIPTTTVLEDGVTYYVNQTVGTCTSDYLAIKVTKVLGTEQVTFKNLTVYPNPAINNLTITNTKNISRIVIVNMLGQIVTDRKFDAASVTVNVEQLSASTYMLQVYSDNQTATFKFIKQ